MPLGDQDYENLTVKISDLGEETQKLMIAEEIMQEVMERDEIEKYIGEVDGEIEFDKKYKIRNLNGKNVDTIEKEVIPKIMEDYEDELLGRGFPRYIVEDSVEILGEKLDREEIRKYAKEMRYSQTKGE